MLWTSVINLPERKRAPGVSWLLGAGAGQGRGREGDLWLNQVELGMQVCLSKHVCDTGEYDCLSV